MCAHVENVEAVEVEVEVEWWRLCIGRWTVTPHLLEIAAHDCHPLLYRLYMLHPLLLILLMLRLRLHIPPVGLLKLSLHWFIQCMHPITDVLHIGPNRPSSRHKDWRIWPAINGSHTVNLPLVVVANYLDPYLVVTNRWASRNAPVPLLQLLQSGLGQSLDELMLQLEQITPHFCQRRTLFFNEKRYLNVFSPTHTWCIKVLGFISASPL